MRVWCSTFTYQSIIHSYKYYTRFINVSVPQIWNTLYSLTYYKHARQILKVAAVSLYLNFSALDYSCGPRAPSTYWLRNYSSFKSVLVCLTVNNVFHNLINDTASCEVGYRQDRDDLISHVVMKDGKWISYFNPETKSSIQFRKTLSNLSTKIFRLILWYNGATITAKVYCKIARTYQNKRYSLHTVA